MNTPADDIDEFLFSTLMVISPAWVSTMTMEGQRQSIPVSGFVKKDDEIDEEQVVDQEQNVDKEWAVAPHELEDLRNEIHTLRETMVREYSKAMLTAWMYLMESF